MRKININKDIIKSESGVSLIALTVMIIIMIILAAISIYAGTASMVDIVERQDRSVINMIQEIVISQYSKATYSGHTNIKISENPLQPTSFYGECIKKASNYVVQPADNPNLFPSVADYMTMINDPNTTYEECYYRLGPSDLKALGIEDATENNEHVHVYVVNYLTGEVYDETLAESRYYVHGNKELINKVEDIPEDIETVDFSD